MQSHNVESTTHNPFFQRSFIKNSVAKPRKTKKKILPKSVLYDEFFELMKNLPVNDKSARVAFLLSYGSGLRISEVLHLEKKHITDRIFVEQGKYSRDRVVPLPKGWKSCLLSELLIRIHTRQTKTDCRNYWEDFDEHSIL